jgi:hypothetical protein
MRRKILRAGIAVLVPFLAAGFLPLATAVDWIPAYERGAWSSPWALSPARMGVRVRPCKTSSTINRETIAVYSGAVEFDRHRDPVDSRQNAVWLSKGECVRIISESDKKLCVVTPDQQPQNNCLTVDKSNIAR